MKTKIKSLILSITLAVLAGGVEAANGHIWDIRPCTKDGVVTEPYKTAAEPETGAGREFYFLIRLISDYGPEDQQYIDNGMVFHPWYPEYCGPGSVTTAKAYPIQVGIYVSGQLKWADLIERKFSSLNGFTDLIFKYVTEPGDFAMPIRLAGKNGPIGYRGSGQQLTDAYEIYFNPLRLGSDNWRIKNADDQDANFWMFNDATGSRENQPYMTPALDEGKNRLGDLGLVYCGFYIQTVYFDEYWENPGEWWRKVHQDSTVVEGAQNPKIFANSAPTKAVDLYVWSEDESAVRVVGGVKTKLWLNGSGTETKETYVAKVTLEANQLTENFQIWGVTQGKSTNLVLSAWTNYNYALSGERFIDYVTVPVKTTEPMPPTLIVSSDASRVYVGHDYSPAQAKLTVELSKPYTNDVLVQVRVTSANEVITTNDLRWAEYVQFAANSDTGLIVKPARACEWTTLRLQYDPVNGTMGNASLYAFFLKSDENVGGGANQLVFEARVLDQENATLADIETYFDTPLQYQFASVAAEATKPVIVQPAEDDYYTGWTCGDDISFTISVEDIYADENVANSNAYFNGVLPTRYIEDDDGVGHNVEYGYEIWFKPRSSDSFQLLDGTYYPGDGGVLYKLERNAEGRLLKNLPIVVYPSSGEHIQSAIKVVSPISGMTSEIRKFYVDIKEPRTIQLFSTDEEKSGVYNEGEIASFSIILSEKNETGNTLYAYLVADDTTAIKAAGAKPFILGIGDPYAKGLAINNGSKQTGGAIILQDGTLPNTGGRMYGFSVILSTKSQLDMTEQLAIIANAKGSGLCESGYNSEYMNLVVYNVEPKIDGFEMDGWPADGDGYRYESMVPFSIKKTFQVLVSDDGAYDLDADPLSDDAFQVRYTWYLNGSAQGKPTVKKGNPNEIENALTREFNQAGEWSVKVEIKDKDMNKWSAVYWTIYFTVIDKPGITVEARSTIPETETTNSIMVALGYWDDKVKDDGSPAWSNKLTVKLTVMPYNNIWYANYGTLKLEERYRSTNAVDATVNPYTGEVETNVYYVTFSDALPREVMIEYADGTDRSSSRGWIIKAEMDSTTALPTPNQNADEYYQDGSKRIYVYNVAPEVSIDGGIAQNDSSHRYNVSGGAATGFDIKWAVRDDVDDDWHRSWLEDSSITGIQVVVSGSLNNGFSTNIQDITSGKFTPNFGSFQGDAEVVLQVTDKDGGTVVKRWYFNVAPSKFVMTLPVGPAGGIAGSAYEAKYKGTKGLGQGHMFARDATFSSSKEFDITWNYGNSKEASIYAYGYKVAANLDDGTLDNGNDIALDKHGDGTYDVNRWGNANIHTNTDCYAYYMVLTNYNARNEMTVGSYDSYFYAWILHETQDETAALTDVMVGNQPAPERPGQVGSPYTFKLPSKVEDDGSYKRTHVTGIFSLEYLPSDNLGDINRDGIPDWFAITHVWSGQSFDISSGNLIEFTTGIETDADEEVYPKRDRDLMDLSKSNKDVGVDGEQFGDFLPCCYDDKTLETLVGVRAMSSGGYAFANRIDDAGNTIVFASAKSYAPIGIPFSARLEIRGFHDGLNATDVTKSDPDFSDDEMAAWLAYSARFYGTHEEYVTNIVDDVEIVTTNTVPAVTNMNLTIWSPEPRSNTFRRMDPTLCDTDGDGFEDGWEYFFWYQAHVWVRAGTGMGLPQEGQDYVYERFGTALRGVPIDPDEVELRFNPCESNRLLVDENPDFDGDGLTDLEEYVIGTNPCHWDTDGDKMCDYWEVVNCTNPFDDDRTENPDGDYMAQFTTEGLLGWDVSPAAQLDPGVRNAVTSAVLAVDYKRQLVVDYHYEIIVDAEENVIAYRTLREITPADGIEWLIVKPLIAGGEPFYYGGDSEMPGKYGMILADRPYSHFTTTEVTIPEGSYLSINGDVAGNREFDVIIMHDEVRKLFGFDPRTGWSGVSGGPVAGRWANPAEGTAGTAQNTAAYENFDEYLLTRYFIDYKSMIRHELEYEYGEGAEGALAHSTNPSVAYPIDVLEQDETGTYVNITNQPDVTVYEGEVKATNRTVTAAIADLLTQAFGASGGLHAVNVAHGADTNGDGVPDGWSLYMGRHPAMGTPEPDGFGEPGAADFDGDTLTFAQEYAGTDSCDAYKSCPSIYDNHPGESKGWFNKFFPTNPGEFKADFDPDPLESPKDRSATDTDGDGLTDGEEGEAWTAVFPNGGILNSPVSFSFIYGATAGAQPTDDGTSCVRGGGMNPCSVDTDLDGLPDAWEKEFAGVICDAATREYVMPDGAQEETMTPKLDDATFIADGIFSGGGSGCYIAGGMDATWPGDAYTDPDETTHHSTDDRLGTLRDVDFDHDGLQPYQEYLVQSVRHFRWDDITTPLMGRVFEEGTYGLNMDTGRLDLFTPHKQDFAGFVRMFGDADAFCQNAAQKWEGGDASRITYTSNVIDAIIYEVEWGEDTKTLTQLVWRVSTNVMDSARLVSKHRRGYEVTAGSETNRLSHLYSASWMTEGWRHAGYFAPPKHDWDRATACGQIKARYMFRPTAISDDAPSATAYLTTDPRMHDTDDDGMDDYYEMFHGLNPILGSTAPGEKDVIANAYGNPRYFNACWNEWVCPDYNRLGILANDLPRPTGMNTASQDAGALFNGVARNNAMTTCEALDPVLYPWMMGASQADPDGDGIRNDEERLFANGTSPQNLHTDPTPMWFTDSTSPKSYVSQYYRAGEPVYTEDGAPSLPCVPGWESHINVLSYENVSLMGGTMKFLYAFEENEGYDTDGDWVPDSREIIRSVKRATDPLDANDPARRQALYFDGEKSYAMSREQSYRGIEAVDLLKQFTVEAWVRPDGERPGHEEIILERTAIYSADSNQKLAKALRANFRIGISVDGRVYGMFDNNDAVESGSNMSLSCQRVDGHILERNKWSHIALTYNGKKLVLYVNGAIVDSADTSLIPANGITQIKQDPASTNGLFVYYHYETMPTTFFVGAGPKLLDNVADRDIPLYTYVIAEEPPDPEAGEVEEEPMGPVIQSTTTDGVRAANDVDDIVDATKHVEDFGNMRHYFKGWIDEVRVWDGARSSAEIVENQYKRFTTDDIEDLRTSVYEVWKNNGTRNDNDGYPMLPAELIQHYNFASIPGSYEKLYASKEPIGFTDAVLKQANVNYGVDNVGEMDLNGLYANINYLKGGTHGEVTNGLAIGWWGSMNTKSTTFTNYSVYPSAMNSVSHLVSMDGAAPDSYFYADTIAGVYTPATWHNLNKFTFPNTVNPYRTKTYYFDQYIQYFQRQRYVEQLGPSFQSAVDLYEFQLRSGFIGTSDLVILGGVWAKTCKEMWDGSVMDAWEYTGTDTDADGLPDWYELFANAEYGGTLEIDKYDWEKTVNYHGAEIAAYQAYLIDLARGLQPDGTFDKDLVSNVDADGDNLPDWWEDLFGVNEYGADDDPDRDGLSNYSEYLISFGPDPYGFDNGFPFLNPKLPRTGMDQQVTDYYLAGPTNDIDAAARHISKNSYLGEIVTDHDMMEDWWEKQYSLNYASLGSWDQLDDQDEDGWDNFSEARAFTWRGAFASDLIDRYLDGQQSIKCHPMPALGLRITYHGVQDTVDKGLVVRVYNGVSARVDATFVVQGSANGVQSQQQLIGGYFGDATIHGFLNPGNVVPGSGIFTYAAMTSGKRYTWILDGTADPTVAQQTYVGTYEEFRQTLRYYPNASLIDTDIVWEQFAQSISDASGHYGDIYFSPTNSSTRAKIGTIDYRSGEYSINLGTFTTVSGIDLDQAVFRVDWNYRLGRNWPQTVWVSDPDVGRVKQGLNTIEAFIDIDGDGTYTPGEPYGMIKNVSIGWHKLPETVIELKDESTAIERMTVGGGNGTGAAALTTKVVVRRKGINGDTVIGGKTVPVRSLASHVFVNDDRAYITEADILSADKPDLDWKWLVKDATKLGIVLQDLKSAEYDVERVDVDANGASVYTVIGSFSNEFNVQRTKPVAKEPTDEAPVYSARPTFSFTSSDDTMKAYRLQIISATNATEYLYDSGVCMLPGKVGLTAGVAAYEVQPEIYVGCAVTTNGSSVFFDASNYWWRVALLNAKFNVAEDSSVYSDWTKFQMDTKNVNRKPHIVTGYGNCAASVRYFGTAQKDDLKGKCVVEVFDNADFTGQPLAKMRITDTGSVTSRTDLVTTNVRFAGVRPGVVYLRAYLDLDNDNKHSSWEPWGYANQVGTDLPAIYAPYGLTVTDVTEECPSVTIYIEDCDTNKNEIPDCSEKKFYESEETTVVTSGTGDGDKDGLTDTDEDNYGTDATMWDTDSDGMPDGWEAKFADLDPNFSDANEFADGDVMAYAVIDATMVTVKSTMSTADAVNYILKTGVTVPDVGDDAAGLEVYKSFTYPVYAHFVETNMTTDAATGELIPNVNEYDKLVEYVGRGGELEVESPSDPAFTNLVAATKKVQVVLVHAQVYEEFGFEQFCATTAENAAHTKNFTALDKYLVCRYLESLGVCTEENVNLANLWKNYTLKPYDTDFDADGLPDGWELYMMFGTNADWKAAWTSGNVLSPWRFSDRATDFDGDGLSLIREYNRGSSTDPWNEHTVSTEFNDGAAYDYNLMTPQNQLEDDDNDGLSNWAEYFASETLKVAKLDVAKMFSTVTNLDYFLRTGTGKDIRYLGQVKGVGDADFMESVLEDRYGYNRNVYDSMLDADHNGWKNFSDLRAAQWYEAHPTTVTVIDYDDQGQAVGSHEAIAAYEGIPRPTLDFTVTYRGDKNLGNAPIQISVYRGAAMQKADATFTVTPDALQESNGYMTFSVKTPAAGALREGSNHFMIFADVDGSGTFEPGEPMGIVRNVEVGWANRPSVAVELTDYSPIAPRLKLADGGAVDRVVVKGTATNTSYITYFALPAGEGFDAFGEEVRVRVVRHSINGITEKVNRRTVLDRTFRLANRDFLHEGDFFIGANRIDIERHDVTKTNGVEEAYVTYLDADAKAAGIAGGAKDVTSVSYDVILGEGPTSRQKTVGLFANFVNRYGTARIKPTPVSPSAKIGSTLVDDQPVFVFTGTADEYTSFKVQVADAATNVLWTSDVETLPCADERGFVYTAPIWVGQTMTTAGSNSVNSAILADGSNYFWRAAFVSGKFGKVEAADYGDWAGFSTEVKPANNAMTGRGTIDVEVRYYGATEGYGWTNTRYVIVEAFATPDFSGKAASSVRLAANALETLAKTPLTKDTFLKVDANATLIGLKPGEWYVRAFLDRNDNGKCDSYETWGYVNKIATGAADLYTPVATTASATKGQRPRVVLVMEDTDVNQNYVPDNFDDEADLKAALAAATELTDDAGGGSGGTAVDTSDEDRDGLTADEEANDYGTNSGSFDTDEDGLPDGWEAKFAETDPVSTDADLTDGTMMAYAQLTATLVTLEGDNETKYAVLDENYLGGKNLAGVTAYKVFKYGDELALGGKTNLTCSAAAVEVAQVAAIHATVYDLFGYSKATANAARGAVDATTTTTDPTAAIDPNDTNAVAAAAAATTTTTTSYSGTNTRLMTALDKYLVAEYLVNVGYFTREQVDGMHTNKTWSSYTLKPGTGDNDKDGIADGWELYVMFGTNTVWSKENALISPFEGGQADVKLDGVTPVAEKLNAGLDPWNAYSVWQALGSDKNRRFTDVEAIRYGFLDGEFDKDPDFDGLSNWQEMLAFRNDTNLVLKIDSAMSDGVTNDYFRATESSYTGYLYNGGEFIEPAGRSLLGIEDYRYAGTMSDESGWDYWSVVRSSWLAASTNGLEKVVPTPTMNLTLRYAGSAAQTVTVIAYQVNPSIPERGVEQQASWTVAAAFNGGVAHVTLGTPDTGSLKQGDATFTAFIDAAGDGFDYGDTYGTTETTVGYVGGDISIALGDPNPALPVISLKDAGGDICQVIAIVRTQINGADVEPRGVALRVYENNVARDCVYPSDYLTDDYIGLDPYLLTGGDKDPSEDDIEKAFLKHMDWPERFAAPYFVKASAKLAAAFEPHAIQGVTMSAPGFYGPQGRSVRMKLTCPDLIQKMESFEFGEWKITNIEMESSALAGMAAVLGHDAGTVCLIIANRYALESNPDYKPLMEGLAKLSLETLTK